MNLRVAHGASLIFGRLVVYRTDGTRGREGMALQAQHVDQADLEQTRICRTVGSVATAAALGLHRHMLVYERSLLVDMALRTSGVSASQGLHLPNRARAVGVMAVTALHQTFIYAMVVRLGKIRLGRSMASVTQLRLALHHQVLLLLRVMRRVAIKTPDVTAGVRRFREMGLRMSLAVATQTAGTAGLPRLPREAEYFGFVATPGHVIRSRTVAAFATLIGGATTFVEGRLPVRAFLPAVVNLLVASFASFRSHVLRVVLHRGRRWLALLAFVGCSRKRWGHREKRQQRKGGCYP